MNKNLNISYSVWKQVVQNNLWEHYHFIKSEDEVDLWAGNNDLIYSTTAHDSDYTDWDTTFLSGSIAVECPDDAIALLVGLENLKPRQKDDEGRVIVALPKSQADNVPVIAIQPSLGAESIYATHNYCDPCTWYSESVRQSLEILSEISGAFQSTNELWVDMSHGRIFDEKALIIDQSIFEPGDPHGYSVDITKDGQLMSQRSNFDTQGGDYTVDYISGTIHPVSGNWSGSVVSASYSYAASSAWILKPLPGKVITMEKAEAQFASDISMTSAFEMEVFGFAAIFAPEYIQSNGGPLPDDAHVSIDKTVYQTIDQLIDEAVQSFPQIPPLSSTTSRGFTKHRNIFQFHYGRARKMYDSLGMYTRISLQNDERWYGERATATFYLSTENDQGVGYSLKELGLL